MKNLLLSILLTIGFISHAQAGTIIIKREGQDFSSRTLHVGLLPDSAHQENMVLKPGETEKSFKDYPNGLYTGLDYDDGGSYEESIDCQPFKGVVLVKEGSQHTITLVRNLQTKSVTCHVEGY